MIQIAIVEDEVDYRDTLKQYISRFAQERSIDTQATGFPNGIEFLRTFKGQYDVILLDIEMPLLDGMETAHRLRELDPYVILVFITNMAQLALKGYEVNAYDFVVKPLTYPAFDLKMRKILRILRKRTGKYLMLPLKGARVKLSSEEVCYIEVRDHRLYCHTKEETLLMSSGTLSKLEEELRGEHFVPCNSCYLVNLRHVEALEKDTVVVAGDRLAVSRSKKRTFIQALTEFVEES